MQLKVFIETLQAFLVFVRQTMVASVTQALLDRREFKPDRAQRESEQLIEHLRAEFARLEWVMTRDLQTL